MRPSLPGCAPLDGTSPALAARLIQDVGSLDELEEAWETLATRASSPTQLYDWIRACAATFATRGELHVVAVGQRPDLAAVAPLVRRLDALGRLHLVGSAELDEPTDILASDPAAVELLAETLLRSGRPLFLKRVPADSPMVAAVRSVYRGQGIVLCRRQIGCPWIPLDPSWAEPEQHLKPGRRSDLRRARRIAEEMGRVSAGVLSPAPGELEPLLREAFEVEAAGWKGREGSALAHDHVRQAFFRRYAAAACRQGVLRLSFLRIDGRAAAMQLAVEFGGRFWLLKIGYDEAFARCSPGTLLMLETVRYAAARGLASYELLGTVEPWTRMWTQLERPCVSLQAYPATGEGMAALVADFAAMGGRQLGRLMRQIDVWS